MRRLMLYYTFDRKPIDTMRMIECVHIDLYRVAEGMQLALGTHEANEASAIVHSIFQNSVQVPQLTNTKGEALRHTVSIFYFHDWKENSKDICSDLDGTVVLRTSGNGRQ